MIKFCVIVAVLMFSLSVIAAEPSCTNSIFNPRIFPQAGGYLRQSAGSLEFNTGNGSNILPVLHAVAGGATNVMSGVVVTNGSGKVVMALYAFDRINIGSGVVCSVTGNLGVIVSSVHDFTFGGTVSNSGTAGRAGADQVYGGVGTGGGGAEGGVRSTSYMSAPPGAVRGAGGIGVWTGAGGNGVGRGGGEGARPGAGSGASYGGVGGNADVLAAGVYGDAALTDLFGGSGGGGGSGYTGGGGGGGGGGTVEFVSCGRLTFSGLIDVGGGAGGSGYEGGGGSGGAVILAAPQLSCAGGRLRACGGSGGMYGGGGGGGRIGVYGVLNTPLSSTNCAGGMSIYSPGGEGSYTNIIAFPFRASGASGTSITIR